jgi:hypothetical protein
MRPQTFGIVSMWLRRTSKLPFAAFAALLWMTLTQDNYVIVSQERDLGIKLWHSVNYFGMLQ